MTVSLDDLSRATQALRASAADYGAWLEVAAILGALGLADDAEVAFATIGAGARSSGRVALAVACGRHLAQLGSLRGSDLLEEVVETYATGGPHFGLQKPVQPEPPAVEFLESGSAVDDARATIHALGPWLAQRTSKAVSPAPLLSALSKSGARALIGVMTARVYAAGTSIVEMGAPASELYWLAYGSVSVTRGDAQLGELHSGSFFGEIALVGGTHRTASVVAQSDVWLLEIPAKAVEMAAAKDPQLADVLAFHARARLLSNVVRTSELFTALSADERDALLGKFTTEIVPAGTAFITDGQPNDYLWVVVTGRCEVRNGAAIVAELSSGDAVGEMSLATGRAASADVVAVEPAVLLKLSKHDFAAVASKHPALMAEIARLALARDDENRALFHDATDLIL